MHCVDKVYVITANTCTISRQYEICLNHLNCTVVHQKLAAELQRHLSAARMDQDFIALGTMQKHPDDLR